MHTLKKLALGSLATGALLLGSFAGATGAQAAPFCQFSLGFAAIDALIPTPVGACLEDENHNPLNGDGLQHTSGGLLVWRKADNWTAFTDGYQTWINGPYGLQERRNDQLFSWEKAEQAQSPATILLDQSGNGDAVTAAINPKGNYDIAYQIACTPAGNGGLFQIVAKAATSGTYDDLADAPHTATAQGTFHFTRPGPHTLSILSFDSCAWHISVTG